MEVQFTEPSFNVSQSNKRGNREIKVAIAEFDTKTNNLQNNVIGEAKTGLFNSKTPIISTEPITAIFQKTLQKGFKNYGFIVTDAQSADYIVDGTVERFWVDEYATGLSLEYSKAYVRYDLLIQTTGGKIVWANTQEKYETSSTSWDATDHSISTLRIALQKSVESIFNDSSFWTSVQDRE
jgi:hypothetical protein